MSLVLSTIFQTIRNTITAFPSTVRAGFSQGLLRRLMITPPPVVGPHGPTLADMEAPQAANVEAQPPNFEAQPSNVEAEAANVEAEAAILEALQAVDLEVLVADLEAALELDLEALQEAVNLEAVVADLEAVLEVANLEAPTLADFEALQEAAKLPMEALVTDLEALQVAALEGLQLAEADEGRG
jgi:hypothetical protein